MVSARSAAVSETVYTSAALSSLGDLQACSHIRGADLDRHPVLLTLKGSLIDMLVK
jgi:hypothetical protein